MSKKLDASKYDFIIIGLVMIAGDGSEHAIERLDDAGGNRVTFSLFGHIPDEGRDELQMDFDSEDDAIYMAELLSTTWNMEYTLEY